MLTLSLRQLEGQHLSEPEYTPTQLAPIRGKALALLAQRDHSVFELRTKLLQRGYAVTEIAPILEEFCAENWLNDARFAATYVRIYQNKGAGPKKVSYLLNNLGVSKEIIALAIQQVERDWLEIAKQVAEKKIGNLDKMTRQQAYRLGQFLAQRGFEWEMIRQIIND